MRYKMDKTLPFPLDDALVQSPPKVFADLKYCVEGTLDPKITKLLENGGGTLVKYPTVSTAHMIAGEGANEVTLQEAEEIFDLPVVQPRWVAFCAKAGKLLSTNGFEGQTKRLFSSIRVTTAGIKGNDLKMVWASVTYHGGTFTRHLLSTTTHLITNTCDSSKYKLAKEKGIKVVCCDWVTDCVKNKSIVAETKYDPQYLIKPEPVKSTTQQSQQLKISKSETSASATTSVATPTTPTAKGANRQPKTTGTPARPTLTADTLTPRARATAVRQPKANQGQPKAPGAVTPNRVRAHRPLLFGSGQQTSAKASKAAAATLATTKETPTAKQSAAQASQPRAQTPQQNQPQLPQVPTQGQSPTTSSPITTTAPVQPPQQTPPPPPTSQPQSQSQQLPPLPPQTMAQQQQQQQQHPVVQQQIMQQTVSQVPVSQSMRPHLQQTQLQKPIMQQSQLQSQPQLQQGQMQQQPLQIQQQHIHQNQMQATNTMGDLQPQLQNVLTQQQSNQGAQQHSLQMIHHQQQQNLQMHMQQLHPNVSSATQQQQQQQQQGIMQGHQGQQVQGLQQLPGGHQQMQNMHHQSMQQNQMGIQHQIQGQSQQQLQRSPIQTQNHQMHLNQQQQIQSGQIQFQHNQQQMQQSLMSHQIQMQQGQQQHQQHGLQQLQQVQPPQKSPIQQVQGMPQNQQMGQPQSIQMQQGGLVHQIGMQPQQGYSMQNQQLLNQQQQQQQQHMQVQGVMRPPQSPQQQQGQQPVHFQILQPQNRVQLVMQAKPQFQQTTTASTSPIQMNNPQQGVFRPQQHPQQNQMMQQSQQGQLFHSLQQPQQQPRPQGIMQMQQSQPQQQQQQQQQQHSIQVMQGGQSVQVSNSHQQGNSMGMQSQQMQTKQFQEIGPVSGQQMQPGNQHYNVVIHQGQQFTQMNPPPPRPMGQPRHPGQPGQMVPGQAQVQQGQQKIGGFIPGQQARPTMSQFTQMEIIRQINMDPNIKSKWNQMDQQQRHLLVQKLAQRHREDQLRKEMMLRQQQLNQQNANMQGMQSQQIPPPGSPHMQPMTSTAQSPIPGQEKMNQQGGPTVVPQSTASPLAQSNSPQLIQGQMQGSPVVANTSQQQQMVQNHAVMSQQSQQKLLSPQSPSPTQKFPPPSPLQTLQTRSPTHSSIPGQHPQSQASGTIVRTQQVFTPQVGSPQQRMVNVQHVLVQPQQQQQHPRFGQQQQIILQQHQQSLPQGTSPTGAGNQPKVAILQGSPQSPAQQPGSGSQWMPPGSPHVQTARLSSPTSQSPSPFSIRMQSPEQQRAPAGPGQVWNGRQPSPVGPSTPIPPGTPTSPQFVQVVNSKTKTALANLLNNRLQGNCTGTETSTTTSSSISTTHMMCEASAQNLPVTPQLSLQQQCVAGASAEAQTCQSLNITNQRRTLSNLTNSSKNIHQVNAYGASAQTSTPGIRSASVVSMNQASSPVTLSPTRTAFYGHEPSFKAPSNGFLVGCVFWPVQLQEPPPNWTETVTYYGGEVVSEYNPSKVTHVVCKNQKFPEFQQVLRDGKRLVTLYWLSDVCTRKVMAPPFYAMHLPTSFNDDNMPLKGMAFSSTGFDKEDRERIMKMLKLLGGQFTPYFTKLNAGLIACRTEGNKFARAREYKVPIVNIQFLNELLLGNQQAVMQMMHSPKYQVFNLEQPFRFDITVAPHLMAAWKTPVRVASDMVEKLKSLKRPNEKLDEEIQKAKRIKLDEAIAQLAYFEEGTAITEESADAENETKPVVDADTKIPIVVFSGFYEKALAAATAKVLSLGGQIANDVKDATHLVCWENVTVKVYSALCACKFIVGAKWIQDSVKAKRFLNEAQYIPNLKTFNTIHNVTITDVLKKPDRQSLFKGLTFYITPGITGFNREAVKSVIECGGGLVDRIQNNSLSEVKLKAKKARKYIIVTCPSDYAYFGEFFYKKTSKQLSIVYPPFLYQCVVEQKVDLGFAPLKKSVPKEEPANSG